MQLEELLEAAELGPVEQALEQLVLELVQVLLVLALEPEPQVLQVQQLAQALALEQLVLELVQVPLVLALEPEPKVQALAQVRLGLLMVQRLVLPLELQVLALGQPLVVGLEQVLQIAVAFVVLPCQAACSF